MRHDVFLIDDGI